MASSDEGYVEHDERNANQGLDLLPLRDREELVYKLLASLPRSQIAQVHRRLATYVQLDILAALPTELALLVLSQLSWQTLLKCALVSRRWRLLANDNSLWHTLCDKEGWEWRRPTISRSSNLLFRDAHVYDSDDEGVGEDEDDYGGYVAQSPPPSSTSAVSSSTTTASSEVVGLPASPRIGQTSTRQTASTPTLRLKLTIPQRRQLVNRHSAPPVLPTAEPSEPDYKLLHQTHRLLQARFRHGAFRFSTLQTRGTPNTHTGIIYCLQLYSYPDSEGGHQVLFTGSKDRTVREWNLRTGVVERVFQGAHSGSVLSLCAHGGFLATAGSDMRICIWDLRARDGSTSRSTAPVRVLTGHTESVLCVRFDDQRLVSCSKDHTVRICRFPGGIAAALSSPSSKPPLALEILGSHRAAVNAVALSSRFVISASGDKSLRMWDAETGAQLRTYDAHHQRGIASIDFAYPLVLTGSSDCHLRAYDIEKRRGWCTSDEPPPLKCLTRQLCEACGGAVGVQSPVGTTSAEGGIEGPSRRGSMIPREMMHTNLVRSVALGPHFVASGSYDQSVKVWDKETGDLVADLTGKHDARVFSVGIDYTKIVSCGEDQKICIWDVSYGIDTSFVKL